MVFPSLEDFSTVCCDSHSQGFSIVNEIKEQAMNRMTALELTAVCMRAKLFQSCPTLWVPMDCSPPGSSVHGISQTRILEWVAISFSTGSSGPRGQNQVFSTGRGILNH